MKQNLLKDNLISSKEELLSLLKRRKREFNHYLYDYFNSLINLEISAIKCPLSSHYNGEKTNFYYQVVRYNIFYKAIKLAKELNPHMQIMGNQTKGCLYIMLNGQKIFSYVVHPSEDDIDINSIYLYQLIADENIKKQQLEENYKELSNCRNQQGPTENIIDNYYWKLEQIRNIENIERQIAKIFSYDSLSKKQIDTINLAYQSYLDDYGLKADCFSSLSPLYKDGVSETLIRKRSNAEIHNNIRYI